MPWFSNLLRSVFGIPQVISNPQPLLVLPQPPLPQAFPGVNLLTQGIMQICGASDTNPVAVAASPLQSLSSTTPSLLGQTLHQSSSGGASSSTDPMPTSVLGSGVHRYLTLADIARLQQVSQTAHQEIDQHGGANYVQSLLHTDVAQLSPVILNELILMGQPIQLRNGAFLNCLSDAAFQRYMAQQTNLHANDIIGLDPRHVGLLTEYQLLSAFTNLVDTEAWVTPAPDVRLQDVYLSLQKSKILGAHHTTPGPMCLPVLLILQDYYEIHPANVNDFHALIHQILTSYNLDLNQHPDLLQIFYDLDATLSEETSSDSDLRRLAVRPEEFANNEHTLGNLRANKFIQTQLETSSDHDWIGVVLLKGHTYTFRMTKIGGNLDTYLTLRDVRGNEVTHNDDADATLNSRITFTADNSGVFYLDASSYNAQSSGSYEIRSNLDVGVLGVNSQYTSALTADKKNQLYKLELKSGHRYEFQMNKEPTGLYFDAYLYLRDANKNEITRDDDSGGSLNSKISYTAHSDGVYYLDATSYNQNSVGQYTVVSHQIM